MPFVLPETRPAIMGILNVTPDSFSDGGLYVDVTKALSRALDMVAEGADIIDVGGESTRPGAEPVPVDEELRRVIPVVESLTSKGITVSIDTSKAAVAREALAAGATVVNDVTAGSDPEMLDTCLKTGATICLMHMQGDPRTMQHSPAYDDVAAEVLAFLTRRAADFSTLGEGHVWIDPGIGFGKTVGHNLELIARISEFVQSGYPVLLGVSRKSFIGRILEHDGTQAPMAERIEGGLALQTYAQTKGVRIFRTHDVAQAVRAAMITAALMDHSP